MTHSFFLLNKFYKRNKQIRNISLVPCMSSLSTFVFTIYKNSSRLVGLKFFVFKNKIVVYLLIFLDFKNIV